MTRIVCVLMAGTRIVCVLPGAAAEAAQVGRLFLGAQVPGLAARQKQGFCFVLMPGGRAVRAHEPFRWNGPQGSVCKGSWKHLGGRVGIVHCSWPTATAMNQH